VRIFDGRSDALSAPSDVLIKEGRIAAIAPPGELREAAERIDGRGRTLLPGLIDCHVHLGGGDGAPPWTAKRPNPDAQSAALLYAGVTTILAAAQDSDLASMKSRIAAGELAGPRIISSSRIFTAVEGHPVPLLRAIIPWPVSAFIVRSRVVQVADAQHARAAVDEEIADTDPDFVKIIYDDIPPGGPRLDRATLGAIIDEVRAKGRRASVHVGSPQEALEAVEAGASLLMHVPGDEPLSEEQARKLAASGVPLVTTSRIYSVLDGAIKGTLTFSPLEKLVMPPGADDDFAHEPAGYVVPGFPQSYLDSMPERSANGARNVKMLADAGAQLIAGTDSGLPGVFHGAALHRELQALVAIGLPPARVLRMATSEAARVIDPKADYGRIEVGQRADLLLVDGDPLADVSATEKIVGVWQDGRAIRRGPAISDR
jgi:imidazolonepropionase-like amidohydrolase